MLRRRVVVTGLGAVSPAGGCVEDLWQAVTTDVAPVAASVRVVAESDHDLLPDFPVRGVRRLARFTRLALAAASQTLPAGVPLAAERCGVSTGSACGGLEEIEQQQERLQLRGAARVSPFLIPRLIINSATGNIAVQKRLQGPGVSFSSGCASGSQAIGEAFRMIQAGAAELMVAGGSEAALTPYGLEDFRRHGLAAPQVLPEGFVSAPFASDSGGFIPSEGSGFVVLEELQAARARKAKILAEVTGYSAEFDPSCGDFTLSASENQCRVMEQALCDAGLSPGQIDLISAHATGFAEGDQREADAIRRCFEHAPNIPAVMALKGILGHSLGAGGALEFVVCVRALRQQFAPAAGDRKTGSIVQDLNLLRRGNPQKIRHVMQSSFSFGGYNCSLILSKYEA